MDRKYLRGLCDADNAVLLVIDVQGKIFEMAFNSAELRVGVDKLMRLADLFQVPVVLTEQYPKGLGPTVPELRERYDALETEKHFMEKLAFGCCGEPGFDELIAQVAGKVRDRRQSSDPQRPVDIVVAGIESHVCVQQTVLELLGQNYRVVVLGDCIGGRVEANHHFALERFRQCGAVITNFESLAFEWTRTKEHEAFKRMSALVREGL